MGEDTGMKGKKSKHKEYITSTLPSVDKSRCLFARCVKVRRPTCCEFYRGYSSCQCLSPGETYEGTVHFEPMDVRQSY